MNKRGSKDSRPLGIKLLVAFFIFGATMAGLTSFLLACPGTALDAIWKLKPTARGELAQLGGWGVLVMALTSAACGAAATGLARGAEWGRRIAIVVLAINLLGDTGNALIRHDWRTLIGLPIGGAMIAYLVRLGRDRA